MAFKNLCEKKWIGESIDVYATEIRRFARCAGLSGEVIVKRALVNGLPENFAMVNVEQCEIESDRIVKQNGNLRGKCSLEKRMEY